MTTYMMRLASVTAFISVEARVMMEKTIEVKLKKE